MWSGSQKGSIVKDSPVPDLLDHDDLIRRAVKVIRRSQELIERTAELLRKQEKPVQSENQR